MRQIKFRAWDDLNKKWLLGYEQLGGFSMWGETMMFGEYSKMLESFRLEDLDKIIIEQFTGLQDKNGNDIYEGDVLMVECPYREQEKTITVEFKNGTYVIEWDGMFYEGSDITTIGWAMDLDFTFEIISNIHDIP